MSSLQNIRGLSRRDFAVMGIEDLAYVKPIPASEEGTAYAVHAADGTQIAVFNDREIAFAAVIQNGMEPVSAH